MPIYAPGKDAPQSEWDAFFESQGTDKVRMLVTSGGWPQVIHFPAVQWLSRNEAASEAIKEASQSEQISINRSAKDAAWAAATAAERAALAAETANTRANIALVIAAASTMITIIGLFLVHWDAMRAIARH